MHSNHLRRATALCLALAIPHAPLQAQDDRDSTAQATAGWVAGQSSAQLDALRNSNWRITDLEVQSTSPLLFRAAIVQNAGALQKTWYWYPNLSAAEMTGKLLQHRARLIDIEPFVLNGEIRYAGVMVDNQGVNAR